ncbi:MAG: class I SAM-dependent methyltransferase [Pseudomonadaceae bacterium]|nr:class I SAM-dependent methyltransferase [Pseudomonadaceae bacterium]
MSDADKNTPASHKNKWDERYRSTSLTWSAQPNALFAEIVKDLPPGKALDVACGEGRHASWLAERGWQVTAVDFSTVGLAKAQQIAQQRDLDVCWLEHDVTTPMDNLGIFDLVAVIFLHTDPRSRELWFAHVRSCVAPGGLLVYIGHDPDNIGRGSGGPDRPEVLPDAGELAGLLPGFEILRAETVERPVTAEPGHDHHSQGTALDTVVVARRPAD